MICVRVAAALLAIVFAGCPHTGVEIRVDAGAVAASREPAPPGTPAILQTQFGLAGEHSVRIVIRRAGWYRVTWNELRLAGMPRGDPGRLRLFDHGVQVPIAAPADAPDTAFEFYGAALDTPNTDVRTYWLTAGPGDALRVPSAPAVPLSGSKVVRSFSAQAIHSEHQNYYPLALGSRPDDFFGPLLAGASVTQELAIQNLGGTSGQAARLEIALQAVAGGPHSVAVEVNGAAVGTVAFSGLSPARRSLAVRVGLLHDGRNSIAFTPSAAHDDRTLLEALRLTYPRRLVAAGGRLAFTAIAGQTVGLDGFTGPQIRVLDVTDPMAVHELAPRVRTRGNGYEASLRIPATSGTALHRLLAVMASYALAPRQVLANHPSSWHDPGHRADLVAIGYRPFLAAVVPLVRLRRREGLRVAVVDVQDIYDEFGYGDHGPQPIRDFLQTAQSTWAIPPRYVLLVGGASLDPNGYLHEGLGDYVPTQMVDVGALRVPSDEWLVDFAGDGTPALALGRSRH